MVRPRIVTFAAVTVKDPTEPADVPSISMRGAPPATQSSSVVPSIVTASLMDGRPLPGTTVCTPAPGISNSIVSAPAFVFAALIASRRLQLASQAPAASGVVLATDALGNEAGAGVQS